MQAGVSSAGPHTYYLILLTALGLEYYLFFRDKEQKFSVPASVLSVVLSAC